MTGAWAFGLLALLGLALGSFGNVVISRLPRGGSLLWPGSHCPECGRGIKPWHNVPVLSFVWLRGRCAACGWKIPLRYLGVELLAGVAACLAFYRYGWSFQGAGAFVLAYFLLLLAFIDMEVFSLPDTLTFSLLVLGLLFSSVRSGLSAEMACPGLGQALVGTGLCGVLMLLVASAYPGGLGFGDLKLGAALGAWLGPIEGLQAILGAFVMGGLVSGWLLLRGHKGRKDRIPLGPFLSLSAMVFLILTAQDIVLE